MELRPASPADLAIILHHRREMFSEMGGDYQSQLDDFEPASRLYFNSALRDGSYYGVFGEVDGATVAGGGVVIAAWPGSPLNFDPRRAWILNVYVEPEHRGRGYARAVMEALIDWCRGQGFRSVALHASEEGRTLYDKLGFRSTNEMRLKL
jgi:GNAT superfamily N-acetyltransferase